MKRPPAALILVFCALLLAPWIGGHVTIDARPIGQSVAASFSGVFGDGELPAIAHALVAALSFAALGIVAWRHKVIQTPSLRVSVPIVCLVALLGTSILISSFRYVSVRVWLEWVAYTGVFFAIIAVSGRGSGPRTLLWAVVSGCSIVAAKGVMEYGQMRALDSSHRIFAGWNNPNALAAMLLLGLFPAVAFSLESERIHRIVAAACSILIGFALVLTQSKGGYAAASVGAALMITLAWTWGSWRKALSAVVPFLLIVTLTAALQVSQTNQRGGRALGRVADSGSTTEQSAGFRRMLWISAIMQIQQSPQGLGVGTYGFHSSRTGLVQQTHLTHNSYLQLAFEASPLAALALIVAILSWLWEMLRSARKIPPERNLLRAGIIAAIIATSAHGLVDSGLYYFGVGFVFFALMALGLQLAADGSGPEFVPKSLRRVSTMILIAMPACGIIYFGLVEWKKATARGQAVAGLETNTAALTSIAPWDGEAWYLRALLTPDSTPEQRIAWLRIAASLSPKTRYTRALAQAYAQNGQSASASAALEETLQEDPNNLHALDQLLQLQIEDSRSDEAMLTAQRLVAVEDDPYFNIQAIPEIVPTETFFAREFLSARALEPARRLELLEPAVEGLLRYSNVTVPMVLLFSKSDPQNGYLGETLSDAALKLERAKGMALRLERLYLELKDASGAAEARDAVEAFEWRLAEIGGSNK